MARRRRARSGALEADDFEELLEVNHNKHFNSYFQVIEYNDNQKGIILSKHN